MKKILIVLAILMLTACNNSYSNISNGDEVLFKGPKGVYTKQELYQSLKKLSADALKDELISSIAVNYDLDVEAIEADAKEAVDELVNSGYEPYIVSSYGSVENYQNSYILSKKLEKLSAKYVEENFDEMIKEDIPVKMQLAEFTTEEDALKCLEEIENGATFDTASLNNNSQSSPEASIFTDTDTTVSLEIKEYLNSTDKLGLSDIIRVITSNTDAEGNVIETTTFCIVNVESRDVNDFKDEYIKLAALNVDSDNLYHYLFNKHKIEFFDQDLYSALSKEFEELK